MLKRIILLLMLLLQVLFMAACDKASCEKSVSSQIRYPVYALTTSSRGRDSITKIDGEKDEIVDLIKLPDVAYSFSVTPNGKLVIPVVGRADTHKQDVYVVSGDDEKLSKPMKLKYIPDDIIMVNDRIGVVVHNTFTARKTIPLTLIDIEKRKEIGSFEVHGWLGGAFYENNAVLLYLGGIEPGEWNGVYRIDLDTMALSEVMKLGNSQDFGQGERTIFRNGKLYGLRGWRKGAHLSLNKTLQVINLKTKEIEKVLPLSDNIHALAFVEDKIYVTHSNAGSHQPDNRVSIIDSTSYKIEDILEVGKDPTSICYSRKLGKVYIANYKDGSVSIIDPKTRKVIKTIPTGQKFTIVVRCPE